VSVLIGVGVVSVCVGSGSVWCRVWRWLRCCSVLASDWRWLRCGGCVGVGVGSVLGFGAGVGRWLRCWVSELVLALCRCGVGVGVVSGWRRFSVVSWCWCRIDVGVVVGVVLESVLASESVSAVGVGVVLSRCWRRSVSASEVALVSELWSRVGVAVVSALAVRRHRIRSHHHIIRRRALDRPTNPKCSSIRLPDPVIVLMINGGLLTRCRPTSDSTKELMKSMRRLIQVPSSNCRIGAHLKSADRYDQSSPTAIARPYSDRKRRNCLSVLFVKEAPIVESMFRLQPSKGAISALVAPKL